MNSKSIWQKLSDQMQILRKKKDIFKKSWKHIKPQQLRRIKDLMNYLKKIKSSSPTKKEYLLLKSENSIHNK